ncbi:MAG: membrane protein insertase YidC, partial [Spirochaetaceae bacterium]|nr:membrane protein insertase YidC [Spirochaetaceae bacterium]
MEKQTILAIVLSSLVIFGWVAIQPKLFPPSQAPETEQSSGTGQAGPVTPAAGSGSAVSPAEGPPARSVEAVAANTETAPADNTAREEISEPAAIPETEERILVETGLIRAVLTSRGGDMVSYRLKEHDDKGELVEMILPARNEEGGFRESHAFTLAFGGPEAQPVGSYFQVSQPDPLTVEFTQDFTVTGSSGTFTLTKRYEFKPDEYMFRLTVSTGSSSAISLDFNNAAYTLGFGPQIGPRFESLDQRYETL